MRTDSWRCGALLAACMTLAMAAPALAQKSADTLRITWRDAIPDVDPYYNSQRTGMVVAFHAFDCLVYRDPVTMEMKPALATSWKQVDATTIDFTLREGVTFQNGDPFTADDVVYTINDIIHDKQVAIPAYYVSYAGAEKIDDFHVRLKLTGVSPAVMEYLAMVTPIWPKAYREKIGADAYAHAPIGTGPYKITKVDGTTEIDMERYDGYYAGSPKGRPSIRYIKIHEVPDATTELTELLGGKADWIWGYNADQFANIARMPNLEAVRFGTMRVHFMTVDGAGRSGADNPLTKLKVRQAIISAIDRGTMAMQLAEAGKAPLYSGSWGSNSVNDTSAFMPYWLGGGLNDYARDADVQKLLKQAGASIDPEERRKAFGEAIHLATERVDFVPLFSDVRYVAFSKQLNFQGFPDDVPRFYLSTWK